VKPSESRQERLLKVFLVSLEEKGDSVTREGSDTSWSLDISD